MDQDTIQSELGLYPCKSCKKSVDGLYCSDWKRCEPCLIYRRKADEIRREQSKEETRQLLSVGPEILLRRCTY